MQKASNDLPKIFDTTELTDKVPVSPLGCLFSMYPSTHPDLLHFHDFLELGYCDCGSGFFVIDGKINPYSGKTCSIIYPGQAHIAQDGSENNSLWHFLYVDLGKLFRGVEVPPISGLNATNFGCYEFKNLFSFADEPDIYEIVRAILFETEHNRRMYRQAITGLVYALLIKHSRLMTPVKAPVLQRNLSEEMTVLLNFINLNYFNDISIQDMEKAAGMSKPTLLRKMRTLLNMTPMEYVHSLRLCRASILLQTNKLIGQIATEVGYGTISCFNRKFLDKYGVSPSQYKKNFLSSP